MDSSWEFVLTAVLLIVLVRNYKAIVYYLKFMYYYGVMSVVMTFMIPYLLLKPRNVVNFITLAGNLKHVSKVIGIKWTLRGSENLEKDQTCVFVANHQTSLDVQGMMDVWPVIRKMTAIAKRELLYTTGSFGIAMYLAGLTFINRKAGGKAGQEMNDALNAFKKEKIKLWVFPEGTRRNTGEIHEFKKGAFYAAVQAQVPIVPVIFSSYKNILDTKKKVFDNGEIIITALPEISTKGLTADDVDDLVKRTRDSMIAIYKKTSRETELSLLAADEEKED